MTIGSVEYHTVLTVSVVEYHFRLDCQAAQRSLGERRASHFSDDDYVMMGLLHD
jgi:hypothetical protein